MPGQGFYKLLPANKADQLMAIVSNMVQRGDECVWKSRGVPTPLTNGPPAKTIVKHVKMERSHCRRMPVIQREDDSSHETNESRLMRLMRAV